jgi:hypothetical protein
LPDYIKFIQVQLKGLSGDTTILPTNFFEKLFFGLPVFSFGWFNKTDPQTKYHIALNKGNAGAFITQVQVVKETNRAFIVFSNAATDKTEQGVTILQNYLQLIYRQQILPGVL